MSNVFKTRIVRMGNSQGIRLPKLLIEQAGLGPEIEVEVAADHLTIRTARRPRQGRDERFATMAAHGDDAPLDADAPLTNWDVAGVEVVKYLGRLTDDEQQAVLDGLAEMFAE